MDKHESKQPPELANPQIGRYAVERLLARGGMAEVFLGKAIGPAGFSKRVVIKRILPHLAQDESFVTMFLNEARLAAVLEHPNIVQVFDFGRHAEAYYLAMEYVEGESLRAILRYYHFRGERIPLTPLLAWVKHVCEGLAYAHDLNIVHRDITPENILISRAGTAKVVDFGVAKAALNPHLTTEGKVRGKLSYIAPEQILSERVDGRADVYSLGVTVYEALAGRCPHSGANDLELLNNILNGKPPPLQEIRPDVDSTLSAMVSRAMARDREHRYPDMQALHSEIDDYLDSHGLRVKISELTDIVDRVAPWTARSTSAGSRSRGSPWSPSPAPEPWDRGRPRQAPSQLPPPLRSAAGEPALHEVPDREAAPARRWARPRRWQLVLGAFLASAIAIAVSGAALRGTERSAGVYADAAPMARPDALQSGTPRRVATLGSSAPPILLVPGRAEGAASPVPVASPAPTLEMNPAQRAPTSAAISPALRKPFAAAHRAPHSTSARAARPEPPTAAEANPPEPSEAAAPSAQPATGEDGWLNLRTDPWCEVYFRGELVGTTPINRLVFPAGQHSLRLVNGKMGIEKDVVVIVRPGEESTARLRLSDD